MVGIEKDGGIGSERCGGSCCIAFTVSVEEVEWWWNSWAGGVEVEKPLFIEAFAFIGRTPGFCRPYGYVWVECRGSLPL